MEEARITVVFNFDFCILLSVFTEICSIAEYTYSRKCIPMQSTEMDLMLGVGIKRQSGGYILPIPTLRRLHAQLCYYTNI